MYGMTPLLIIDDDTELCALLAEFLAREGFSAALEHDGVPPGVLDPDRISPEALWAIVEGAKASASTAVRRIRRGDLRHDPRGGECPTYCPWSGVCRIPR